MRFSVFFFFFCHGEKISVLISYKGRHAMFIFVSVLGGVMQQHLVLPSA